jgi:NADH:ubiquinone oxidoreductase subunit B-like Fe-S oxidoreductase
VRCTCMRMRAYVIRVGSSAGGGGLAGACVYVLCMCAHVLCVNVYVKGIIFR